MDPPGRRVETIVGDNPDRDIRVRAAEASDGSALARLYNHYVLNTIVTFEESAVSPGEMAERVAEAARANLPFLVAESTGNLLGFAYASPWKGRCAYRFSAETTVYVDAAQGRRGIGSLLYRQLLPRLHGSGIHTVMGGIALPNDASVALHEKFRFKPVALFREVGFKFGSWIDVGYWQLVFE